MKRLRPYLPNTSNRLALVGSRTGASEPDMRSYWPVRVTQIVGGKRWSISFIRYRTPGPIRADRGVS